MEFACSDSDLEYAIRTLVTSKSVGSLRTCHALCRSDLHKYTNVRLWMISGVTEGYTAQLDGSSLVIVQLSQ